MSLINSKLLTEKEILELPNPIILCGEYQDFKYIIENSGYTRITLNLPLSKALLKRSKDELHSLITITINNLIKNSRQIFLTNFEVLFNPAYKIDVIRQILEIAKYNDLLVLWPGDFNNDYLLYAEPGYADYKNYKISNYHISCVI